MGRRTAAFAATLGMLLAMTGSASGAVYFGATIGGETYGQTGHAPGNQAAWNLFERHAGKKVSVLNISHSWAQFEKEDMDKIRTRGAVPLVLMGLGSGVTLEEIAKGEHDTAIEAWGKAAKEWKRPFFFAPWWEMNGSWYAWGRNPSFVAAWRRFHDLVVGQGATNVTWMWVTNGIWFDPKSDPEEWYPGEAYVDWVGIDSYNWGLNPAQPDRWISPERAFTPTLERIEEFSTKPVYINETASSDVGGNKADWIEELLSTYIPGHPRIRGFSWFNWDLPGKVGGQADWSIESSTSAQQAFRKAIQSSFYKGGPVQLPDLTKVPVPTPAPGGDAPGVIDLGAAGEIAGEPDLAVAPNGVATVVWSQRSGSRFVVLARRIGADGKPIGSPTAISDPTQDALDPSVAAAADGSATVAWSEWAEEGGKTDFVIRCRRISPGGVLEGPSSLSAVGRDSVDPDVATGPGGTATVVWKRADGEDHYLIKVRQIDAGGVPLGSGGATFSEPLQDASEPRVLVGPDGTSTVAWIRYDGSETYDLGDGIVQARTLAEDGALSPTTLDLSAGGQSANGLRIAAAPFGAVTLVWTRSNGGNELVQARRVAGASVGPAVDVSASGQDAAEPQVAVGPDGTATIVWERFDGANFVVQSRRLLGDGNLGSAPLTLSQAGRDTAEPDVGVAPDGTAAVVWSRSDGASFVAQRRALDATGVPSSTTESLSAAGRSARAPLTAFAPDGAPTTVWARFNGGGDVVQGLTVPRPRPPEEPGVPGEPGGGSPVPAKNSTTATAVDSSFAIGKPRLNLRKGTAKLPVKVPGPGTLAPSLGRVVAVNAAGTVLLSVKPTSRARKRLERRGRVQVKLSITYAPKGGSPSTQSVVLRLRKTLAKG